MMLEKRYELNKNLAQMLKGGVIMDVTTPEQAKIAARNAIIEQNKQLNRYIPSHNAQNGIQQPINNHTINFSILVR